MGTCGYLWGHMGAYGDLSGPMGTYGGPWGPMGTYGDLWGPMGTYGGPWGTMGTYGGLWGPMGTYGDLWALMGAYGDPSEPIVTTKPTPDTVHSPTLGQLHVESIQLACTCALCCCYALCMKREELSIFQSLWLRCFVVMLQYVGFLGRNQLFGSQVKVGAPSWRAPSPVLARVKSGFGARQLPHSSCLFAPRAPYTLHAFPLPSRHLTTLFF